MEGGRKHFGFFAYREQDRGKLFERREGDCQQTSKSWWFKERAGRINLWTDTGRSVEVRASHWKIIKRRRRKG